MLTKTVRLLDLAILDESLATYDNSEPSDGVEADIALSFTRDVYDDLGSPSQITVTVEPGDHLNGAE